MLPNVAPDEGLSASYNSFFTLFGQFFDHGLDLVAKGGNGTVYMPLSPDDPLYNPDSPHTNFMAMTRATVGEGAGNVTTPWVDQNQTYTLESVPPGLHPRIRAGRRRSCRDRPPAEWSEWRRPCNLGRRQGSGADIARHRAHRSRCHQRVRSSRWIPTATSSPGRTVASARRSASKPTGLRSCSKEILPHRSIRRDRRRRPHRRRLP